MNNVIVHVSEVPVTTTTGMGRVEYYWKQAFERAGFTFIHIGPEEVGRVRHKGLFPYQAFRYFKNLNIKPSAFIIHEPSAGVFVNRGVPCFVESHGIERKFWENTNQSKASFKTRLLFPLWRLRNADRGLKKAYKLLLINSDDSSYVQQYYRRRVEDINIFKNGIQRFNSLSEKNNTDFVVLFNGSWIERKGIRTLVESAVSLKHSGLDIKYLLIGTSKSVDEVFSDWPSELHSALEVVPRFESHEEGELLSRASVFVLPSLSEGQPLSLLQAMHAGLCCITTNCCGQKDIITHGINGLLFEPGNPKELSDLIKDCYSKADQVNKIGKEASLAVNQRTWENVSDEVVSYVKNQIELYQFPK